MDILNRIQQLKSKNNLASIYEFFHSLDNSQQAEVWKNAKILNEIGFACGKLAEVSIHEIPKNDIDKKRFLKEKAKYRDETKRLRERCLEIESNNLSYLSSLAYLHYRNALELNQPRGRRDGNKKKEADAATEYYNQILTIDCSRIKDLYRKSYILTEILPGTCWGNGNVTLANQKRLEGIQTFQKAIQIWEFLDCNNNQQKLERDRCRKEYIKSLYSTGSAYCEMIINKWDEAIFALELRKIVNREDNATYYPQDLENANNAWQYFHKCWETDRPDGAVATITTTGACEGVDKLYALGKVAFAQYWILSGNGQKKDEDVSKAIEYRDRAEKYLNEALEFPWSPNKQSQKKDYIAERLARLYISKGEYEQAAEVINNHRSSKLDAYICHTLALALMLLGKHNEAQIHLQEAIDSRGNVDRWTSHFLIDCSLLRQNYLDAARQKFQNLAEERITDTLLFAQALIAYKFYKRDGMTEKKEIAVELIKQANQNNPYRVSIGKSLEKWSKGKVHSVIPVQTRSHYQRRSLQPLEVEDYTRYEYEAFGYDEDMGIDFDSYLDRYGYS